MLLRWWMFLYFSPLQSWFWLFAGFAMVLCPVSRSDAADSLGYLRLEGGFGGQKVTQSGQEYERVSSIVRRIERSVGLAPVKVFVAMGSREVNAVSFSNGSVVVSEELLRRIRDEDELATVVAHELAHLVANHLPKNVRHFAPSGERAAAEGGEAGSVALELEADRIGLFLMARAGYDPRAAIALWERAADVFLGAPSAGKSASHPCFSTRAARLHEILPEAWTQYQHSRSNAQPPHGQGATLKLTTPPSKKRILGSQVKHK